MPKVSVCIPVYCVEKYIEQCARSLFEQTLDDIEFIFVDDCSPDNSVAILERTIKEYPQRIKQVSLIHHEKNQGHSGVFKTLLTNASGEYVITCDSDDWVESDMYEKMYRKAKETNTNIVCCDYYLEKFNTQTYAVSHFEGSTDARIRAWIKREYAAYSWATMCHRSLIEKMEYISCGYVEDCVRACQVLHYAASSYAYVTEPLYHYRDEGQGVTTYAKQRFRMEMHRIAYDWITLFLHKEYGQYYETDLNTTKLLLKFSWCRFGIIPEFYEVWPEANHDYLLQQLPLPIEKKILVWLALYRQKWLFNALVKTYNLIKKK